MAAAGWWLRVKTLLYGGALVAFYAALLIAREDLLGFGSMLFAMGSLRYVMHEHRMIEEFHGLLPEALTLTAMASALMAGFHSAAYLPWR